MRNLTRPIPPWWLSSGTGISTKILLSESRRPHVCVLHNCLLSFQIEHILQNKKKSTHWHIILVFMIKRWSSNCPPSMLLQSFAMLLLVYQNNATHQTNYLRCESQLSETSTPGVQCHKVSHLGCWVNWQIWSLEGTATFQWSEVLISTLSPQVKCFSSL